MEPRLASISRFSCLNLPSAGIASALVASFETQSFEFFYFSWDWGLNSGLCTCKAGALLLETHLQLQKF
jgi:hypothetical protein